MTESEWRPRRWNDSVQGCYWLGRMMDKGRRKLAGDAVGRDLLSPYQFGRHNPTDGILLRFLGIREHQVVEALENFPDDEAAAAGILALAGWSARKVSAWNFWFSGLYGPILAMIDADEGWLPEGVRTAVLRGTIRTFIEPVVARYYNSRQGKQGAGPPR